MGRYFGIKNKTKKQVVSSYWKGDEWCDCYQVMHQLHWDKTDKIYSGCYDTLCKFKYNTEDDAMECIDMTEKSQQKYEEKCEKICNEFHKCHICDKCNGCIVCYGCCCEEHEDEDNHKCGFTKDACICKCDNCNGPDKIDLSDGEQPNINTESYGFDTNMNDEDIYEMLHHVPDWDDNNVCRKCNYKYDDTLLEKYKESFDGVYCMN